MGDTPVRTALCLRCPFNGTKTQDEVIKLLEGYPDDHDLELGVLCTFDMEERPEREWHLCRGFYENCVRLNLIDDPTV